MYIQKVGLNTFNRQNVTPQKSEISARNFPQKDLPLSGYCYRPLFNRQVSFKGGCSLGRTASQNIDSLQETLKILLTPIKKDFIIKKKSALVDYFNGFQEVEFGKMAMTAEPDFKFVFKELKNPNFKDEQFSVRVVDLKKGEFDFGFFDEKDNLQRIKVKNKQFYSLDNPEKPLSYAEVVARRLEDKFNDMLPIIEQGLIKVDDIINGVFNKDAKGYSLFLTRGIKKRFFELDSFLRGVEQEKRHALKRSYSKYIPYPNKTALMFKDSDRMFSDRLVFLPQREGDETLFRITKFDSDSNIQDSYLIDLEKGVYKNYCKRKIFNIKNVSVIPKNEEKMTSAEIVSTDLIPLLEKYYGMIDDFSEYVHKNSGKSAKVLLEESRSKDYIPYNMIRQNFLDRLDYILPQGEKELSFMASDGSKHLLRKIELEGVNVIEVSRMTETGKVSVFINEADSRIIDVMSNGSIVRDKQGQIRQIPHSSDAFKIRSRVLQGFIDEAFDKKTFIHDEGVVSQLSELGENFKSVSDKWFSTYRNKKTEARKLYGESFIGAKGDVGGFRFAIPNKDYAIALKPHQVGKEKFMRLTVYDKNGEIIDNFLIDEFSKVVDNYCAQGKFSKDAISRVPDKIVYKTDEQIQEAGFPQYLGEYLTELKKFKEFFFEFMDGKQVENVVETA